MLCVTQHNNSPLHELDQETLLRNKIPADDADMVCDQDGERHCQHLISLVIEQQMEFLCVLFGGRGPSPP